MKNYQLNLMYVVVSLAFYNYSVAGELVTPVVEVVGSQEDLMKLPSSAMILDQQELESSHVATTNEALRKVPGLVIRDEEGFGMRPNIGVRGLNPTRSTKVLLLEDGVPVTYAPYGANESYYHPAIDRFSRIEVLKGASQIKYGPLTLGGVINYMTPNAPQEVKGHVSLTGGNRDYLNTKVNIGGHGMLLDYTHKEGDGARDNTHSNVEDLNFKVTKAINDDHAMTLRANWFSEDSQVSYSGITQREFNNFGGEYNPFKNDSFETTRYGLSATHDWQININALLTTNFYYSYFDRDWWRQQSNSAQAISGGAINNASCTALTNNRLLGLAVNSDSCLGNQGRLRTYDTYGVEPRLTITHAWGELEMGAKAHFEKQDRLQVNGATATARIGTLEENNQRETDAYSGFISNRFDIGQFSITPAVRYEHIDNKRINGITRTVLSETKGSSSLSEWIPGVAVAFNPHENLTVFAGVHEGFAPPRSEDLIGPTGGSIDVDVEKSTNWELGFRTKLMAKLNIEATAFYNDFKNLIAVGSVASNVALSQGQATFSGIEFAGQYEFEHGFYSKVAYTWLPIAEQESPFRQVSNNAVVAGSLAGNRQPYAPKHTLTTALGYKMNRWDAQIEAVYVGSQYSDFAETKEVPNNALGLAGQIGEIASYTILNAALNYKYEPYQTTFFVAGKNLLDRDYIVDRTRGILTGMPRFVQVGVRYNF